MAQNLVVLASQDVANIGFTSYSSMCWLLHRANIHFFSSLSNGTLPSNDMLDIKYYTSFRWTLIENEANEAK